MRKYKTINSNDKIVSFEGQLRLLSAKDGWLQKVEVRLLNEEENRNGWIYRNIDEHRKLFARTPILCAYVGDKIADGHNFTMRKDEKEGKEVPDFTAPDAERIVGYFANDEDIRIEFIDGKKWIVGVGTIFTWYNRQLVEKLKSRGSLSVSIETLINEMHYEGKTEVFTKYQILGTTILNEKVNPAVVGANIKTLQFKGDIQEFTMRVASFDKQQLGLPNNEPQTQQNSKKGVGKSMKILNLDDIRDKFEGYTVLGCNGLSVALLSDEGRTFKYTFQENEDTVVPSRIEAVAVNSVFGEGDGAVTVSAEQLIGTEKSQLNAAKAALEKEVQKNAELTAKLNKMEEQETARRKEAVKAAIKSRLADNKRDCGYDLPDTLCDSLMTDECIGKYAGMVDEHGAFCGEKQAMCDVDALCMDEICKENKAKAEQKAKNNGFKWSNIRDGADESGASKGVMSSLARISK